MTWRLFIGKKFRKKITPTPALYPSSKNTDSVGKWRLSYISPLSHPDCMHPDLYLATTALYVPLACISLPHEQNLRINCNPVRSIISKGKDF